MVVPLSPKFNDQFLEEKWPAQLGGGWKLMWLKNKRGEHTHTSVVAKFQELCVDGTPQLGILGSILDGLLSP